LSGLQVPFENIDERYCCLSAFFIYLIMVRLDFPEAIETSRLLIRRLRYEDAEEIFYSYASKPEATRFLSWRTHDSVEDTRTFLSYASQSWNLGLDYSFSIRLKETRRLIGSFGVIDEDGKVQFGYVLSPTQWGQGYATEVCVKMMDVLKSFPTLYRIGTFVDVENIASINVLKKCGLIEEARLPKWFRFVNQDMTPKDCILFRLPLDWN
jgi:[ribosomal protein S5]-alanine N-acetyltransferase